MQGNITLLELVLLINQAKDEGLEPNEASELETVLSEVKTSQQTIR